MKKFVAALFLILSGYRLHAGWFPPDTQFESVDDISGGLYTNREPYKIPKTFSPNMRNVLVDERFLQRRKGWTIAGSTLTMPGGGGITMVGEFIKDNGDRECIVSNSSVVATTRDFTTYTLLRGGWNTTGVPRMAQGRKKVLITNGIDAPIAYDGNTVTVLDGSGGNANVPRGKYPAFYDDRFWIFNSTVNNSALHFSDYITTASEIIDPLTDSRAWQPLNQLNVGFGDGAAGSGLIVNNGQLLAHKYNNSVWTVFGNTLGNYYPRKTNAEVGTVSGDSIALLDGLVYYLAKDGIWEEGPAGRRRITDHIRPDIDLLVSNLTRIVATTWDTESDFKRGATFQKTTATASGFVTIFSTTYTLTATNESSPPSATPILLPINTESAFATVVTTVSVPSIFSGRITRLGLWLVSDTNPSQAHIYIQNTRTGDVCYIKIPVPASTYETFYLSQGFPLGGGSLDVGFSTVTFTGADVSAGNMQIKIKNSGGTGGFSFYAATTTPNSSIWLSSFTDPSGQYISEVSTVATITYWDQFLASDQSNGGSISYYVKGATAPVNITTETWSAIASGGTVNLPTAKNYIQWCATLTATQANATPMIDFVSIYHNEGSASVTRPIAFPWKGRYMLFVTTTSAGTTNLGYWKAKNTSKVTDAIMPIDGINIQSIGKYNENLYAGSSTAPIILRLDNGTNDNGRAINSFFETAAFDFGNGFYEKSLVEYLIDMEGNGGGTLTVGTSVDGRAFTNRTATMYGTDRMLKHLYNVDKYGKYFRFRFDENDLDKDWFMHAFIVGYNAIQIK